MLENNLWYARLIFVVFDSRHQHIYALVNFVIEGCSAVVPLARVAPLPGSDELSIGKECDVLWSSRKHYNGILLLLGILI